MVTLEDRLDSLGLGRYFTVLCENGFDDWDTVLDITEDDLRELGFKLGHRRTLQREIANYRGSATQEGCQSPTVANPSGIMSPITEHSTSNAEMLLSKRKKRRYRWHARPDPNAPKRPKTAYVNFADHLRTDPAIANMSFVEIAKEVGKQWQVMDTGIKQHWETQAAAAMQGYEEQMEAYRRTEKYQQYQEYMENFKKAPGKTTRQKLKTNSSSETVPRSGRSESADSGEGGGPASQDSNGESPERLHDECQRALFKASTELKRLRHEYSDIQPEDTLAMPPDDLARTAIGAMMEGSGSLLYVFSKEQAEKLLADAYDASSKPDSLLLTELCIASAVGGHYNPRAISSSLTKRLAATALAFLESVDATGDEHYLRIMRIMCCFAMHALLEKHVSARCCVTAALVIARWKYPQLSASGDNTASRESWRKVYRTVVFLDCWMCYTLGYASENAHVHLKVRFCARRDDRGKFRLTKTLQYALEAAAPQDSIENAIQHQATKLAVIAAEISHAVQQSDRISRACVDYLIAKLDSWQHELPVPFQLISLMSTGPLPPESERALLMVHVLYLGAVILLHRQLLVAADTDRHAGQWTLAIDEKEIERYQASCEMAAQRVAQLLSMVKLDGYCTLWNWLVT